MEHWILVLISSTSIPLVIGITYKWEPLPTWILCGEVDGTWLAPGQSMDHFSVCNGLMFWSKLLAQIISKSALHSQTARPQSCLPHRHTGVKASAQGFGIDCPTAVHIFRESLKDEDMSSKTACTQWSLDLQCLREESPQVSPQRNLSSRNASRPHKWLSWWALPLISFPSSQTHIQNLEKLCYFPTKPKQIKYSSHPLLMYLT